MEGAILQFFYKQKITLKNAEGGGESPVSLSDRS